MINRSIASIFIFLTIASCRVSTTNKLQQEFKDDAYFFMALQEADNGNTEKAMRFFKNSRDSDTGTPLISRRSAESLTMIGNVLERNEAALYLNEKYGDNEALLVASKELFKQNEFSTIIKLTENINYKNAPNELVKLRFDSMLEKKDSRFESEFYTWIVSRSLSPEHIELYQRYLANKVMTFQTKQAELNEEYQKELKRRIEDWKKDWIEKNPEEELDESIVPSEFDDLKLEILDIPMTDEQSIIDYRIYNYKKNYKEAFRIYKDIVQIYENRAESNALLDIEDQILSDLGKTLLYGTEDYYNSARFLDKLANRLEYEKSFYVYFYAARLYDKGGRYQTIATERFKSALASTTIPEKFDNCLWYLLNFQLRSSTDDIIETLKTYGSSINDSEYFDDFFESLSVLLLSNQKWQDFYEVWKTTNSNFSPTTAGKYAYISGRLLEEGLAEGEEGLKTRQSVDAFLKVISGNGNIYYKVCALERLNITDKTMVESVLLDEKKDNEEESKAKAADVLMKGYAAFGFPQRVYAEWLLNRREISTEVSMEASKFLFDCGQFDSTYDIQSLRIASRAKEAAMGKLPKELLNLVYPRFYEKEIRKVCEANGISEYILYALVRTESFFDPNITSTAGASGLTQLMDSTAGDEARKLKLGDDFNILDPETNLKIGSHYLKSLIGRVDNNIPILALFAYNGGLTNVRKWIASAKKDWATIGKAPHKPTGISVDLFLETLPFTETRDYGRQLVATSAMYAWLYYDKTPAEIVREILYAE